MNKKLKISLIIILIIAILLSVAITFLKIFYKSNDDDKDFDKLLKETIISINEINNKIIPDNLDKEPSYILKEVLECKKYIGNDKDEYIKLIRNTYSNPFYEYSVFNLVKSGDKEELYICLPKECHIDKITEYKLETEEETTKIINVNNGKYKMEKIDNTWKFIYPVILCE